MCDKNHQPLSDVKVLSADMIAFNCNERRQQLILSDEMINKRALLPIVTLTMTANFTSLITISFTILIEMIY